MDSRPPELGPHGDPTPANSGGSAHPLHRRQTRARPPNRSSRSPFSIGSRRRLSTPSGPESSCCTTSSTGSSSGPSRWSSPRTSTTGLLPSSSRTSKQHSSAETGQESVEPMLESAGSTLPLHVEMAGIEPASDDACPSILRVQFAVRCFRPQRSRERVADGPSGVGVPSWPAACQLSSGFRSRRQVLGGKRPQADGFRSSLRRRGRNRCSCSWHLLVRRESLTR